MNILVLGNGGREHAIIDKISQSKLVDNLYIIPGNYGISLQAQAVDIDMFDNEKILEFVKANKIDLVIPGPENVLFNGISDELIKNNIKVLGPTKKASRIEASKEYAKEIMKKNDIPSAAYESFTDFEQAKDYLKTRNTYPIVIKYDGLAAGKGVYIIEEEQTGIEVLNDLLVKKILGNDGLIIEDFLDGDEFTLLALVKGDKVYPFQTARDFKRIFDNDEGLNTGGMGAICPYHGVSQQSYDEAITILNKTAQALVKEDNSFTGVLYGGFIITKQGVKVIEFNARFGDPETECVLNNLASDLVENVLELLNDKPVELKFKDQVSVGVVLSAKGYPEAYEKNVDLTTYLNLPYKILHMQTKELDGKVVSNGGRVLFILNEAKDSKTAFEEIYQELDKISEHKLHFRRDLINY